MPAKSRGPHQGEREGNPASEIKVDGKIDPHSQQH